MESVFRNVALGERLAYQNVVSSRTRFHYSEMLERLESFVTDVSASGYDPKGPLFYSLNNVPIDETADIEMFLPVQQDSPASEGGLHFHSYFEVSPLVRGVVEGDFESQTERVYAQLLATLEMNDLTINSAFFHVLQRDVVPYSLVLVGYRDSTRLDDR